MFHKGSSSHGLWSRQWAIRWKEMALEEEEESKSFETPEDPEDLQNI